MAPETEQTASSSSAELVPSDSTGQGGSTSAQATSAHRGVAWRCGFRRIAFVIAVSLGVYGAIVGGLVGRHSKWVEDARRYAHWRGRALEIAATQSTQKQRDFTKEEEDYLIKEIEIANQHFQRTQRASIALGAVVGLTCGFGALWPAYFFLEALFSWIAAGFTQRSRPPGRASSAGNASGQKPNSDKASNEGHGTR